MLAAWTITRIRRLLQSGRRPCLLVCGEGSTARKRSSRKCRCSLEKMAVNADIHRLSCDLCRTRKVACLADDGSSTCSLCRRRGLTCTFLSKPGVKSRPGYEPARRKSQDDGYIALRMRVLGRQGPANESATPTDEAGPTGAWFNQTTAMEGHTCFYAGMSGDHSPDLLRHLSFNEQNIFGNATWSVWRVHPRTRNPVYFTVGHLRFADTE